MASALGLARRALGRAWPNPAVGCVVIDPSGRVAGRGWTVHSARMGPRGCRYLIGEK